MSRKKKGILIICTILIVCLLTTTVAVVAKRANESVITVIPVDSIYMQNYVEATNVEGNISSTATQKVKVSKDSIIQEAYVKQGDQVHKGDNLLTFDMTLTELELSIAQLTKQSQQMQLKKANERLTSLQNGGPIEEEDGNSGVQEEEISEDDEVVDEDVSAEVIDEASAQSAYSDNGFMTASWKLAVPAFLAASQEEEIPTEEEEPVTDEAAQSEDTPSSQTKADVLTEEPEDLSGADDEETVTPSTAPTAEPTDIPEEEPEEEEPAEEPDEPKEPITPKVDAKKASMIRRLTASTIAFSGDGSAENPFTYICETGVSKVTATKGFLNLMMGYSPDGKEAYEDLGPYCFQLIFYSGEEIKVIHVNAQEDYKEIEFPLTKDSEDPKVTYLQEEGEDGDSEDLEDLNDALDGIWDEDDYYEDDSSYYDDSDADAETENADENSSGVTREEAIKNKKSDIKNLELDIKESDIKISKLQKKLENRTVTSKVNGTVTKMGDPETGAYTGDAFMEVVSDQGMYVTGAVSELLLDEFQEGLVLNGTAYETGEFFKATVTDVADYPADNAQYSSGNPNVSYYPFTAEIEGDTDLSQDAYISLSFEHDSADNSISIIKAFVRTENGQSYVMVDDGGRLKKKYVTVGVSTDGYSIPVKSGLSMEDKIAFPYGKSVREGAKTKEGTIDDVYGY